MKLYVLDLKHIRIFMIAGLLSVAFPANSALIVDTGPGPDPFPGNAWVFNGSDKFAGQFTLSENTSISSIQGWMGINKDGGGFDFNILIYNDINGLPGEVLFSELVFASPPTNVPAGESYGFDWYGLSGLDWNLSIGGYWVSFEGVDPMQPHALMPGPSENPLTYYASKNTILGNDWVAADYLRLGVMIEGSPSTVPIPAAIWLFGSGLIGLIGVARRKKT